MFRHRASRHRYPGGGIVSLIAAVALLVGVGLVGISLASQGASPIAPPRTAAAEETAPPAVIVPQPPRAREEARNEPHTLPTSKPVQLDIPSIDVHSSVQITGQAEDGSIEAPAPGPRYNDAAWYKYSPTPGSLGPAVMLGHVDSAAEGPSVFFRLGELKPGAKISVTRADGSEAVFVVDRVARYAKDDFPTEVVYGDINHAGLRILTCGGAFDDSTGHYLDNIVVFASLIR